MCSTRSLACANLLSRQDGIVTAVVSAGTDLFVCLKMRHTAMIFRMDVTGRVLDVVHDESSISSCSPLTVDRYKQFLYWFDAVHMTISVSKWDGSGLTVYDRLDSSPVWLSHRGHWLHYLLPDHSR